MEIIVPWVQKVIVENIGIEPMCWILFKSFLHV